MAPESLVELAPAFTQCAKQYRSRREEAESAAIEWRWASAPLFSLELLRFERGGHRRGRYLKKEPANNDDRCQYGLDVAGRIVVERHAIWGSEQHKVETFVRYGEEFAESAQYGSMQDKPLDMLVSLAISNAAPQSCRWYSSHQRGSDTYRYDEGRLSEIDSLWSNQPHRDQDLLSAVFQCNYDATGALSLVTVEYRKLGRHPGGRFTCFRLPKRRPGGQG